MGIFDFLNPPAANIPLPQFNNYQPTGFQQAESGALGGIGNLGNFNQYAQYLPQAQGITSNLVNNPWAGGYQTGAGVAGGMGQAGATNAYNAGGSLYGQGSNLFGLGNSIANTAFDPQNDLYARTVQQLQDQTRASEGARGIATTPYGAGLENDAMRKFNTDWQGAQLGRQIAGGQAAGTLYGQGAGLYGAGSGLQSGAATQYGAASAMPYTAANTIGTNQFGALSNLGQFGTAGAQIPQQQIQDWMSYLGWGTGAQNAANTSQQNSFADQLSRDKQAYTEQQGIFGGLGNLAGGASKFFFPGGFQMGAANYGFGMPAPSRG